MVFVIISKRRGNSRITTEKTTEKIISKRNEAIAYTVWLVIDIHYIEYHTCNPVGISYIEYHIHTKLSHI